MATKKITELASLAGTDVASSTDVLPIVDINADATKKVTVDGLHTNSTFTGTATFNGAITASTDYYEPNNIGGPRKDSFIIQEIGNNFKYSISSPVLLDSNLEPITYETNHTLKDNGDGTYEYTKYPNKDLLIKTITGSVNYIDAETVYSDADADGCAFDIFSPLLFFIKN